MPEVSIIVPVYNVERYLRKCIDSILAQTYKDYELILIDDGSTDCCGAICDEYRIKDQRIQVIHKKNEGLSSARNAGMDIAKGTYYLFCDSDDFVTATWCEHFLKHVKSEKDNFIFGGIITTYVYEGTETLDERNTLRIERTYSLSDFIKLQLESQIGFAWNVLYYADVLREHKLRFSQETIVEDLPFNLAYLRYMKELTGTGMADYHYVQDERKTLSKKYYPHSFRRWQGKYQVTQEYIETSIPVYEREELRTLVASAYLYHFLHALDNTFDSRNPQSFLQKLAYNSSVTRDKVFQHCLKYADPGKENPRYVALLKRKNYLLAYALQKLASIKRMLKGENIL